jgi:hypothetical protein
VYKNGPDEIQAHIKSGSVGRVEEKEEKEEQRRE